MAAPVSSDPAKNPGLASCTKFTDQQRCLSLVPRDNQLTGHFQLHVVGGSRQTGNGNRSRNIRLTYPVRSVSEQNKLGSSQFYQARTKMDAAEAERVEFIRNFMPDRTDVGLSGSAGE